MHATQAPATAAANAQQIPFGVTAKAAAPKAAKNKPAATQRTPEQEAARALERAKRYPTAAAQEKLTAAGATVRTKPASNDEIRALLASTGAPKVAAKVAAKAQAGAVGNNAVITLLQPVNPKRGASQARYALYKTGMTVAEYVAAGGLRADIAWDLQRAFISVRDAVAAS